MLLDAKPVDWSPEPAWHNQYWDTGSPSAWPSGYSCPHSHSLSDFYSTSGAHKKQTSFPFSPIPLWMKLQLIQLIPVSKITSKMLTCTHNAVKKFTIATDPWVHAFFFISQHQVSITQKGEGEKCFFVDCKYISNFSEKNWFKKNYMKTLYGFSLLVFTCSFSEMFTDYTFKTVPFTGHFTTINPFTILSVKSWLKKKNLLSFNS